MEYKLAEDGFEVLKNVMPKEFNSYSVPFFKNHLDEVIKDHPIEDIFMTEFGPKQIQHLEKRFWFQTFADNLSMVSGIEGDILNMQIFIKYPNYKITYPHQDGVYFDDRSKKIFTFWVPLQDVYPENSCMHYVPKSHLNGLLEHKQVGSIVRTRTGKTGQSLGCDVFSLDEFVPVPMKSGDVLIHDQYCVHYSSINKSEVPRMALTCIIDKK